MSDVTTRIEPLGKNNFDTWKLQVEALLIKNETWSYVCGENVKPKLVPGDQTSEQAIRTWKEADRKARSDLILAIHPSELKQVKNCETSYEVWEKLHSIYQSKGPARKASLLKKLLQIKLGDGTADIRVHVAEFLDAVDKLQDMGIDINDDLLAIMLLYSLPESYENFRCAIESRDELPKPEMLKVKIFEEFDARKARDVDNTTNAMLVGKAYENRGDKCKETHWKGSYSKSNSYFPFKCHRCRKTGHKAAECKSAYKNVQRKSRVEVSKACMETDRTKNKEEIALVQVERKHNNKWCLDSGCTSHKTARKEDFNRLMKIQKPLNLANGECTAIKGIGDVKLSAYSDNEIQSFRLEKVMFMPDLRTNLLSVAKITDRGYQVQFNKHDARILTQEGKVLAIADRDGDLYFIRKTNESAGIATNNIQSTSQLKLWHEKLGHVNVKCLIEMARKQKVLGLNIGKNENMLPCETCIKAKHSQLPFSPSESTRT